MTLSYLTRGPSAVPRKAHGNKGMVNNKTRDKINQARAGEPLPSDSRYLRSTAWLPLPGAAPIDITQLNDHTCRWPIGTDQVTGYCGHHTETDPRTGRQKSYCPQHMKRATDRTVGKDQPK